MIYVSLFDNFTLLKFVRERLCQLIESRGITPTESVLGRVTGSKPPLTFSGQFRSECKLCIISVTFSVL